MDMFARSKIETSEKWHDLIKEIPSLPIDRLPSGSFIRIIPPFGGAISRFIITDADRKKVRISVYLDWYDQLGWMKKPYWEIYPIDDYTERFALNEIDELCAAICRSYEQQLNKEDEKCE